MRNSPGRRVAGAGVEVAANGLCVTRVELEFFESFDDLDMVDKVLSRAEGLRDPFLNRPEKGMLLCCEKCFVEGMESGWHIDVVSYRKGMIGCYSEIPKKRQTWSKSVKVPDVARLYLLKCKEQSAFEKCWLVLLVVEVLSLTCLT